MNILLSISHGLIALIHLWIAVYFWKKLILPSRSFRRGWKAALAAVALTFFAVGAVRTNVRIAIDSWLDVMHMHWYDILSVSVTLAQALAGLTFMILVARWVRVSLFDRKYFEDIISDENN